MRDGTFRERLMQERGLTLDKCLDMCRAAESASIQAKEIGDAATNTEVNDAKKFGYHATDPAGPKPPPKAKGGKERCSWKAVMQILWIQPCYGPGQLSCLWQEMQQVLRIKPLCREKFKENGAPGHG